MSVCVCVSVSVTSLDYLAPGSVDYNWQEGNSEQRDRTAGLDWMGTERWRERRESRRWHCHHLLRCERIWSLISGHVNHHCWPLRIGQHVHVHTHKHTHTHTFTCSGTPCPFQSSLFPSYSPSLSRALTGLQRSRERDKEKERKSRMSVRNVDENADDNGGGGCGWEMRRRERK